MIKKVSREAVFKSILNEYYSKNFSSIYDPQFIANREFGFSFFDDSFRRHISFRNLKEYVEFVSRMVPKDVYYSVAFYQQPSLPMNEKGWMGAELAFDLDAEQLLKIQDDQIKSGWISPKVYDEIKSKFVYLLEEFIEGDLGISEKEYLLVFSGNRGYHARVFAEPYISLDQRLRRQIVEYVSLGYKPEIPSKGSMIQPFIHDYGWCRRLYEHIRQLDLEKLSQLDAKSGLVARRILSAFKKAKKPSEVRLSRSEISIMNEIFTLTLNASTVSIDERVTVDINRLLRAPGTVHGGSGLVCKILTKKDLERFEPFRDASMVLNSMRKVLIKKLPFEVTINGETVSSELNGKTVELNSALAYYIVVRDGGEFVSEAI